MLSCHDSNAAPQIVQTALPVCGTKNFVSVRLYSAPQLHRTIVAIVETPRGLAIIDGAHRPGISATPSSPNMSLSPDSDARAEIARLLRRAPPVQQARGPTGNVPGPLPSRAAQPGYKPKRVPIEAHKSWSICPRHANPSHVHTEDTRRLPHRQVDAPSLPPDFRASISCRRL